MLTHTTTQVQTDGAVTPVKSAASAAIVGTVLADPCGNGSLATTDRNKFVRVVLALIHVRAFSFFFNLGYSFISDG